MLEQPVSRVLFLNPLRNQAMAIHLGRLLPDASSNLPGSIRRAAFKRFPIWSCTGWGLPSSRCRHRDWWALTSPFHPYPEKFFQLSRAVCFLLHFPWGRPRSLLATTLPCGARTFLRGTMSPGGHLVCSSKI